MLSYLFTYLFIFGWLPNMVNFTLLGARYFPFLYIFLCFVLGCNLVTWKQFEAFNSYFYELLGSERNAQSGVIIPQNWDKIFLSALSKVLWMKSFPAYFVGTSPAPGTVYTPGAVPCDPFAWFVHQPWVVCSYARSARCCATLGEGLAQASHTQGSLLCHFLLQLLSYEPWLPWFSWTLSTLLSSAIFLGSASVPPPSAVARKLPHAFSICVLHHLIARALKTTLSFICLNFVMRCFRWEGKSSPCYST